MLSFEHPSQAHVACQHDFKHLRHLSPPTVHYSAPQLSADRRAHPHTRPPTRHTNALHSILTIAPNFPSPTASRDGQANYLTAAVPALAKLSGANVEVLALRFGDQPESETGPGWTVNRVEPPKPMGTVFDLYLPKHLRRSIESLHKAAVRRAKAMDPETPVWAHGYETGTIVETLVKRGRHVVAVPHYLVGVETLHDLALGDDPIRRDSFNSPWATALGQLTPKSTRPMGVRWASRLGSIARFGVWPSAIKTQFSKLDLERRMVANASHLVAVGPSFEAEMHSLYPCTVGRSREVIAGGPSELPEAQWPWRRKPGSFRIAMVGRPTGQKGWDYAAEAIARLEGTEQDRVELAVIGGLGTGSGPYSDYSQRVSAQFDAIGLDRFANLGELSHSDTLAHLVSADLLLFPSVFEPLGLVLIEAMTAGCCVLASDAAGPSDVVSHPWGRRVPFADPNERADRLTEALQSFLQTDMSVLAQWSTAARVAGARHTWDQCAAVHLDALRSR